jgi:hypothetical protein
VGMYVWDVVSGQHWMHGHVHFPANLHGRSADRGMQLRRYRLQVLCLQRWKPQHDVGSDHDHHERRRPQHDARITRRDDESDDVDDWHGTPQ